MASPPLPNVPLILKAACDDRLKRLRFAAPLEQLTCVQLRSKIAESLQFRDTNFSICWDDDDGETCEIESDLDLREALLYHSPSDPTKAADAVTMRVSVRVDAGVELSDFGGGSSWGGGSVRSFGGGGGGGGSSNVGSDSEDDEARSAWAASSFGSQSSAGTSGVDLGSAWLEAGPHGSMDGNDAGMEAWFASTSSVPQLKPARRGSPEEEGWSSVPSAASVNLISVGPSLSHLSSSQGSSSHYTPRQWKLVSAAPRSTSSTQPASTDYDDEDEPSDAETESGANSSRSAGPSRNFAKARITVAALDALALAPKQGRQIAHEGVACDQCGIDPIRGPRFHCADCPGGRDFCGPCEATARPTSGHAEHHLVLKIAAPLATAAEASSLGTSLMRAQARLYAETEATLRRRASSSSSTPSSSSDDTTRSVPGAWHTPNGSSSTSLGAHGATCDYCSGELVNVRYLCANCPLGENGEGFNLCAACEPHSLQSHDPSHFFLKIRMRPGAIARLAPSPDARTRTESLLPMLYKDLEEQSPAPRCSNTSNSTNASNGGGGAAATDFNACFESTKAKFGTWRKKFKDDIEMRRIALQEAAKARSLVPLDALIHPSILCDLCFEVIEGPWLRCCNCTTSMDFCSTCETKIMHDPTHAFAVFKQPLDLDLFKSAIDMSPDSGALKPLLGRVLVQTDGWEMGRSG